MRMAGRRKVPMGAQTPSSPPCLSLFSPPPLRESQSPSGGVGIGRGRAGAPLGQDSLPHGPFAPQGCLLAFWAPMTTRRPMSGLCRMAQWPTA
ncbi:unnamed protein product [Gulo gulo]|uniref:Uncharacterized protein n=1 Tax=Gulo gulo TaxID=48420 RepID=A0A9X9M335_GULGU|nr:unnamed protein product [Gulo gulo]